MYKHPPRLKNKAKFVPKLCVVECQMSGTNIMLCKSGRGKITASRSVTVTLPYLLSLFWKATKGKKTVTKAEKVKLLQVGQEYMGTTWKAEISKCRKMES